MIEDEAGETLLQITLEATSGEIGNLGKEAYHQGDAGGRSQLFVTAVKGTDGQDLLREEPCGPERNALAAPLTSYEKNLLVDNAFVTVPGGQGGEESTPAPWRSALRCRGAGRPH